MTSSDAAIALRQVAGYRVLRVLARDSDAEVLLGFREGDDAEPAPVVLKVMPSTPQGWATATVIAEALHRASGEHVVTVLDTAADREQICLVMERLPRGDLAELLRRRERLDAGEAVTVLAPLAGTMTRLHASGVAHGALSARAVMFRADGAPVLIGFAHATLFEPDLPEVVLERDAGVVADRRALRELAITVLSRVIGSRLHAARALISELEGCAEEFVVLALSTRIFEVAAALPIRFADDGVSGDAEEGAPRRLLPVRVPDMPDIAGLPAGASPIAGRLASLVGRVVPESWMQTVRDALTRLSTRPELHAVQQRWSTWPASRRRAAVAVGAALAVALLAGLIVPSAPASRTSRAPLAASAAPSTAAGNVTDSPVPSASLASTLAGDDPVAAASALLAQRERCFRSVSVQCLLGVDQADSAAMNADRDAVTSAQHGGELRDPIDDGTTSRVPELLQRWGDSALVRLGSTESAASLLLVTSASGWRIRDVIPAVAPLG